MIKIYVLPWFAARISVFFTIVFFTFNSYSQVTSLENNVNTPDFFQESTPINCFEKILAPPLGKKSVFDERWQQGGIYEGFTPEQEIIDKRSRNTKHFRNSDGTITAQLGPLTHYRDKNGLWQDIDFSITNNYSGYKSSYLYCNQTNELASYFPDKSGQQNITLSLNGNLDFIWWQNPILTIRDNGNIMFSYNATQNSGTINKNTIYYPDVYAGISEEFVVIENGIENNTIIHNSSFLPLGVNANAIAEFTQFIPLQTEWEVHDISGLKNNDFSTDRFFITIPGYENVIAFQPVVVFDNMILNKDHALMLLSAPFEKLSQEQKSLTTKHIIKLNYRIKFVSGGIEVSVLMPVDWLKENYRSYPVTIDPTVEVLTGYGQSSSTEYGMPYNTYYHDQRYDFLLLKGDLIAAGINAGSVISGLGLYCSATSGMAISNFYIRSQQTASTTYTSWLTSGWTTNYYSAGIGTPSSGSWYDYTFSTNITTTSNNLAFNISRDNTSWSGSGGNYIRGSITSRAGYGYSDSGYSWPHDGMTFTSYSYLPCMRITYTAPAEHCYTPTSYDYTITPTTSWQTHSGNYSSGGCRIYRISVVNGYLYNFTTCSSDGVGGASSGDIDFRMHNNSGAYLWYIDGNSGCSWAATTIGSAYADWNPGYTGYAYLQICHYNTCPGSSNDNWTLAYKYTNPCSAPGDQVTYGSGIWNGYVYSPCTGCFSNYVGYVTEAETFDRNFDSFCGGNACGASSNLCGSYADGFTIRYKMNKNFSAGYYIFTVGGDDGVRLSVDGGSTWLISGWVDQGYTTYSNTTPVYLSGSTNLVFEYYENVGGARASFNYQITYCIPSYTNLCSSADFINNFATTGGSTNITNNNSGCNGQANNYIYYSGMSVTQLQGASFNISVQSGSSYGQGFRIWIDWNEDGDFADAGEDVWNSGSSGTGAFTGTITIPGATPVGTKRMRVRCLYAGVPASTDYCTNLSWGETEDYNVVVLSGCTAPTISTQPINNSYCTGGNASFTCVGGPTPSYQWQYNDGSWNNVVNGTPAGATYANPTTSTMTISGISAAGTYQYRCIVSNGCSPNATSNTVILTVNSSSVAPTGATASINPVCPSSPTTLTVTGGSLGSGAVWSWYSGSCGGTFVGSGSSVSVSPLSSTTYFVRATGTCNTTSCASIVVNTKTLSTAPTGITASTNPVCSGNSTTLTVNGGSLGTGASWIWYSGSCGGTYVGSGNSINVSPTTATTFYVRAEGDCNTTTCVLLLININSLSTAPTGITPSSNPSCPGSNITLTVNGGSLGTGASWNWYTGGCGTTLIGTGSSIIVSPAVQTTYYVRAIGTCNTTTCASVTIDMNTLSTAPTTATANPSSIAAGGFSTLTVSGGSLGTGADWTWHSGNCAGAVVGTGSSVNVYPAATTTYYVNAIGTCNTTTCVSVTVTVSAGQVGVINNGAVIYFKGVAGSHAYMYIDGGANGNFYNYTNGVYQGKIYTERFEQYGCYIKLEGNWNNNVDNGVFQQGAAPTTHDFNTTEFLGNTAQIIGGNYKTNFYNLTINNSASSVTMNVNAQAGGITTKTGVFSLLAGPFNINGNLIVVTNPLTGAVTRNTGYIQSTTLDQAFNSRIQWNIGTTSGAHVFPFGTTTAYIPFTFNPAAGTNCGDVTLSTYPTGGATAIDVYNNKPNIVTNLNGIYTGTTPPANAANIVKRFWSISPTVNPVTGGNVTLTFTYGNEEPLNGEDPNNMVAQRYDVPLNSWQPPLAGQTSNTTSNIVVVPGVTQMSPWTISKMTQPLPVELTEFTVSCHNNRSELLWITASETNCDRYEIERSANYSYWEHIATVTGSGYSTTPIVYQYSDIIPYGGTSYYRLRQVDFDGNYTLYGPLSTYCGDFAVNEFEIISISVNSQQKEITVIYKSPEQENNIKIALFNTVGQEIIQRKEASVAGNGILVFSSDYLTTGVYLLNIESSQKKFTQKIVIF
jgi:hypothetical protein